jgi:superfamily I DNA/RNA helicase
MTTTLPRIASVPTLNPTQQQIATAPLDTGLQVLAGAGTGKTELIAQRYCHVYQTLRAQCLERPEAHIVVLTFTDKAATAMAQRIGERLQTLTGVSFDADESDTSFEDLAWITTFHTLGKRLVQRHSSLLGLSAQTNILDRVAQNQVWEKLLTDIRHNRLADLSAHLPDAHGWGLANSVLAVESLTALPVESVGKVIDALKPVILRVKAAGLSPQAFRTQAQHQTQAFTDFITGLPLVDATGEPFVDLADMAHAWTHYLSPYADDAWQPLANESAMPQAGIRTFYRDAIGFLLKGGRFYKTTKKIPEPVYDDFADLHTQTALELQVIDVITAVYGVYQARLRAANALDFDDLIQSAITLLDTQPTLRAQYQQQFRCLIVDEFQDSNGSQLALLRQLMPNPLPDGTPHPAPRLTVVGDIKQSIYGFRFAQPENLRLAFEGTQHQTYSLQTNYRSAPPILDVANALTLALTHDPSQRLAPAQAPQVSLPVLWVSLNNLNHNDHEPEATDNNAPPAALKIGQVRETEAQWFITEIQRLVRDDGWQYGQMAILTPHNTHARRLQRALQVAGIPAACLKLSGLFDEPAIKTAMAWLTWLTEHTLDAPIVRLLAAQLPDALVHRIVLATQTVENHRNLPLWQRLNPALWQADNAPSWCNPALHTALSDLSHQCQTAQAQLNADSHQWSLVQAFQDGAARIGYLDRRWPEATQHEQALALTQFEQLLQQIDDQAVAQTLEANESWQEASNTPLDNPLGQRIAQLHTVANDPQAEFKDLEPDESALGNVVRLGTIHSVKGLEFPVVFVSAIDPIDERAAKANDLLLFDPQFGYKPGFGLMFGTALTGPWAGDSSLKKRLYQNLWLRPRVLAEQQRLFYVALTRAQSRLYVTVGPKSPDWATPEQYLPTNIQVITPGVSE